jgi:hypothetical protein
MDIVEGNAVYLKGYMRFQGYVTAIIKPFAWSEDRIAVVLWNGECDPEEARFMNAKTLVKI